AASRVYRVWSTQSPRRRGRGGWAGFIPQSAQERFGIGIGIGISKDEDAYPRHLYLLCASGKWPHDRHFAADPKDELPPVHSITSSARRSSAGGIVRPRAFAVLTLISSSYFAICSTGRLPAWVPLRILSTYAAPRRAISLKSEA